MSDSDFIMTFAQDVCIIWMAVGLFYLIPTFLSVKDSSLNSFRKSLMCLGYAMFSTVLPFFIYTILG